MTGRRVYLDCNATQALRAEARAAMLSAMDVVGNPSSVHAEGRAARAVVETAREQVAALVNAKPGEIIFTSGATEANALAFSGRPWRSVLVGNAEHVSVLAPARRLDAPRTELSCSRDGVQDLTAAEAWIAALPDGSDPALASLALANGETGVLQPVAELVELCASHGIVVHSDAVQAAGRIPLDFAALGLGLMSLSAHKMGGPKGAGALVVRDGVPLDALFAGGGQERRRRAGTENIAGIAGFGAAAEAAHRDLSDMARIRALRDGLEAELKRITPECIILGAAAERLPNTTLVAMPGKHAETLVIKLDLAGMAVSAGAACSSGKVGTSHVLDAMGLDPAITRAAVRLSIGRETTLEDLMRFAGAWQAAAGQPAMAA
jgi:cysteine desulfurase